MITPIRSPSQNAIVFVVAARMNVRQLAQILCSSHKLLLDPRFSGPEAISANPPACFACAIAPPLAARWHARGALTA
jgi:hypothetical protein